MGKGRRGQATRKRQKGVVRKKLLGAVVFQLLVYLFAIGSCAILTLHSDGGVSHDFYRIVGALSVAAFCASYAAARSRKQQGLLTGFLATLPMHFLILTAAVFLAKCRIDWTLLFSFVILSLVSMLGGVLAVNRTETAHLPNVKQ